MGSEKTAWKLWISEITNAWESQSSVFNNWLEKRHLAIRNLPYTIMRFYRHDSILHSVLLLQGYKKQLSKEDDNVSLLDCQTDWFPTVFMHGKYSFNTEYN